jgi:uncharacterized protein YdeI (YjbR/CyaY-like superfamily)
MKPRFFATPEAFRAWLELHHASAPELLVGFHKTKTGKPSLTWPQSVDEALCFGWIDGVRKSLGETSYTIRFTPRKLTSHWSAVNLKRVKELIAQKRMRPAGLAAWEKRVEGKSGQYSYEQRHAIELTAEALAQLRANQAAWSYFQAQAPSYLVAVRHWVMSAKREETRAKRLEILIGCCAAGQPIPSMRWSKKAG